MFVVHIAALSIDSDDKVHSSKRALIVHLKADKASTKVSDIYADFVDVFFTEVGYRDFRAYGNQ